MTTEAKTQYRTRTSAAGNLLVDRRNKITGEWEFNGYERAKRIADILVSLDLAEWVDGVTAATTVYYAWVEGSSYSFSAIGLTATQAVNGVMSAWRSHVRQTGAERNYIVREDVQILPMTPGQGYRDNDHALGKAVKA